MSKTTVIYHSADFDGIFCREIARKFLPEAELIGWNFGDKKIPFPSEGTVYILDLSPDCLGGDSYDSSRIIWIDHHKTSIEKWPATIPGYRIDGVAACRLAWQWFTCQDSFIDKRFDPELLPEKQTYVDRAVVEPLAVRLAGEYDIWDKRDPEAEVWQFALRSRELTAEDWQALLGTDLPGVPTVALELMKDGYLLQRYQQAQDASVVNHNAQIIEWEGLRFLALNTVRCNSLTFAAKDVPETGHDAILAYGWTGRHWKVSLYHAKHNTGIDLSKIASAHGGGGHRGACGFTTSTLPFKLKS
jgi:hypothetical protein